MALTLNDVLGYVEYLRDLGVYDFYRGQGAAEAVMRPLLDEAAALQPVAVQAERAVMPTAAKPVVKVPVATEKRVAAPGGGTAAVSSLVASAAQPGSSGDVVGVGAVRPVPEVRVAPEGRARALEEVRERIGDCTRCPLAYAGRHEIVFGEGSAVAELMFVGEGPGAEEDATGRPFVGKAGQLLTNMIGAMGLAREQVYIANVVKCRPPQNRVPEPLEATTCSQFLAEQIDIVQPKVIVALGATAATYVLGVRQSLSSLRGQWHASRGAKVMVTYHPAYLLRDPRQKGEAWKDLQQVMGELGLRGPARS